MKTKLYKTIITAVFLIASINLSAQNILRVDQASSATNPDGSSWSLAYQNLQTAIDAAALSGDEIWIAKGVYNPSSSNQSVSFVINKSVEIFGHFDGTELLTTERDLSDVMFENSTRTVLSGDIGVSGDDSDNTNRLILSNQSNLTISLNELSIENGDGANQGAGINLSGNNKTFSLNRVILKNNTATGWGGAIYNGGSVDLIIESSRFIENQSTHGSGIFKLGGADLNIYNSQFIENLATTYGVIYNHNTGSGSANIENSDFSSNNKQSQSAHHPTCIYAHESDMTINNSIFWGNGDTPTNNLEIREGSGSTITVNNSIVQGGYTGTQQSQIFVNSPIWNDDMLNRSPGSEATDNGINTGYNSTSLTDINGDDRIQGGILDIGSQEGTIDPEAFIIEVEVVQPLQGGSQDYWVFIPTTSASNNYQVNWGDGNITSESGRASHLYTNSGKYKIQIIGDFFSIQYHNESANERFKLKSIEQWGAIQWSTFASSFYYCTELEYNADDSPDLSSMNNDASLQNMFYGASKVSNHDEVWDWDVSQVKNMASMFRGATNFNANISGWTMTNVERIDGMFNSASSFNQPIGNWTITDKITSLKHTFSGASSFNFPIDNWDTKNVTDMSGTFHQASVFNQSLNNWEVSKVTKMNQMFLYAFDFNNGEIILNGTSLNGPKPLSHQFWNVGKVESMSQMFRHCVFNQDITDWDVANVTNFQQMFTANDNFNQNLNGWVVSNGINFSDMFANAKEFDSPLNNWLFNTDPTKNINLKGMFQNAIAFNRDLSDWNISIVYNMKNMFSNSGLDECNYDATLEGWADVNQSKQIGVVLGAVGIKYDQGAGFKLILTNSTNQWVITDAGQGAACGGTPRKKSPTSIENSEAENLQFYPNPTSNSFQLNGFEEDVQVTLIDISGKVVLQTNVINNTQIDVSSLSKGVYIIQAIDNFNHSIYDKLIIK